MSIAGLIRAEADPRQSHLAAMVEVLKVAPGQSAVCWGDPSAGLGQVQPRALERHGLEICASETGARLVMTGECFDRHSGAGAPEVCGRADADARYCLDLMERSGPRALERVKGAFALACYSTRTRELILASDRFSSRPLFYTETSDGDFLFATQILALLQHPKVSREVDEASVLTLFATQAVPGTWTLLENVRTLPPASILRRKDGQTRIEPYWRPVYRPERRGVAEWAEALAEGVRRSMHRITADDRTLGVLLSGGLDSRMALAALERDARCYTFGDFQGNEYWVASRLARGKGLPVEFLKRSPAHYLSTLEPATRIGCGMYGFHHAHALEFLARSQIRPQVLLHGLTPERFFRSMALPLKIQSDAHGARRRVLDPTLTEQNLPDRLFRRRYSLVGRNPAQLFTSRYAAEFDAVLRSRAKVLLAEAGESAESVYDKFAWPETRYCSKHPFYLFALSLRPYHVERNFVCDNDLLDLHLEMPPEVRMGDEVWTRAIERLDPHVARVPNANKLGVGRALTALWRLASGQRASSLGSYPHFANQLRHDDRLSRKVLEVIEDPEALDERLFDLRRVREMYDEHQRGAANHFQHLYLAATYGTWRRQVDDAVRAQLPTAAA